MNTNDKSGLKEVANATFYNVMTGKPEIFFDSLKTSTIENSAESTQATGGQGGGALVEWDYNRQTTLTLQDALLSDRSLAILAGTTVKTTGINIHDRQVLAVNAGKVVLPQKPTSLKDVTVFSTANGAMLEEVTAVTLDEADAAGKTLSITGDVTEVEVYYQFEAPSGARQITFSSDKFPATYKVVGDTITRNTSGVDEAMQFVIYRAKLQAGFTLTMDVENPSTFDFNLNAMADPKTKKIMDIIRY